MNSMRLFSLFILACCSVLQVESKLNLPFGKIKDPIKLPASAIQGNDDFNKYLETVEQNDLKPESTTTYLESEENDPVAQPISNVIKQNNTGQQSNATQYTLWRWLHPHNNANVDSNGNANDQGLLAGLNIQKSIGLGKHFDIGHNLNIGLGTLGSHVSDKPLNSGNFNNNGGHGSEIGIDKSGHVASGFDLGHNINLGWKGLGSHGHQVDGSLNGNLHKNGAATSAFDINKSAHLGTNLHVGHNANLGLSGSNSHSHGFGQPSYDYININKMASTRPTLDKFGHSNIGFNANHNINGDFDGSNSQTHDTGAQLYGHSNNNGAPVSELGLHGSNHPGIDVSTSHNINFGLSGLNSHRYGSDRTPEGNIIGSGVNSNSHRYGSDRTPEGNIIGSGVSSNSHTYGSDRTPEGNIIGNGGGSNGHGVGNPNRFEKDFSAGHNINFGWTRSSSNNHNSGGPLDRNLNANGAGINLSNDRSRDFGNHFDINRNVNVHLGALASHENNSPRLPNTNLNGIVPSDDSTDRTHQIGNTFGIHHNADHNINLLWPGSGFHTGSDGSLNENLHGIHGSGSGIIIDKSGHIGTGYRVDSNHNIGVSNSGSRPSTSNNLAESNIASQFYDCDDSLGDSTNTNGGPTIDKSGKVQHHIEIGPDGHFRLRVTANKNLAIGDGLSINNGGGRKKCNSQKLETTTNYSGHGDYLDDHLNTNPNYGLNGGNKGPKIPGFSTGITGQGITSNSFEFSRRKGNFFDSETADENQGPNTETSALQNAQLSINGQMHDLTTVTKKPGTSGSMNRMPGGVESSTNRENINRREDIKPPLSNSNNSHSSNAQNSVVSADARGSHNTATSVNVSRQKNSVENKKNTSTAQNLGSNAGTITSHSSGIAIDTSGKKENTAKSGNSSSQNGEVAINIYGQKGSSVNRETTSQRSGTTSGSTSSRGSGVAVGTSERRENSVGIAGQNHDLNIEASRSQSAGISVNVIGKKESSSGINSESSAGNQSWSTGSSISRGSGVSGAASSQIEKSVNRERTDQSQGWAGGNRGSQSLETSINSSSRKESSSSGGSNSQSQRMSGLSHGAQTSGASVRISEQAKHSNSRDSTHSSAGSISKVSQESNSSVKTEKSFEAQLDELIKKAKEENPGYVVNIQVDKKISNGTGESTVNVLKQTFDLTGEEAEKDFSFKLTGDQKEPVKIDSKNEVLVHARNISMSRVVGNSGYNVQANRQSWSGHSNHRDSNQDSHYRDGSQDSHYRETLRYNPNDRSYMTNTRSRTYESSRRDIE